MESVNNDYILFKENTFLQKSLPILEEFRQEGKFCDVTLKVDGQSFKAHRVVLAATIPYFRSMFTVDMLESNNSEVTIEAIEAETLKSILNFIYSGKIKIDTNTVHSLMYGASYLQLTQIQDACADFMIPRLEICSVLGIIRHADKLNCLKLVEGCKMFIERNFTKVSLCDEFLDLTVDEMMDLLDDDELHVSSEQEVFEALVRWFKKDPTSREKHLPELLSKVRLTLLSLDYLMDNVFQQKFIKSSLECRDLIDEVKDYFLMLQTKGSVPKRFKTHSSFKTVARFCKSVGDQIFAMENSERTGEFQNMIEVYDPLVNKWSLSASKNGKSSKVVVAVMKKILYFIGGYTNGGFGSRIQPEPNTVQTFDSVTKQWSSISPMLNRRSGAGAGVLNGKLYVCGGQSAYGYLNSVECFDSCTWTYVQSMKYKRSSCGVATLNGYLYVAGGFDGSYALNKVEKYDPFANKWTEVAPMLTSRRELGMTELNGKLYACGGHNGTTYQTVEMFNPKDNIWIMVASMNKRRSGFTLIKTGGKLWAIGGFDGQSELSCVEIYDPKLDKWTFGPSMVKIKDSYQELGETF